MFLPFTLKIEPVSFSCFTGACFRSITPYIGRGMSVANRVLEVKFDRNTRLDILVPSACGVPFPSRHHCWGQALQNPTKGVLCFHTVMILKKWMLPVPYCLRIILILDLPTELVREK
jgi:hypothetical protein